MRKHRLLACMMAVIMAVGLIPSTALAASTDDAASSVKLVDITQSLDRVTGTDETKDTIYHDFRTQGEINTLTYTAELTMTETMATHLYKRQAQLLDARFNVDINIDVDKVDFVTTDGSAEFTFGSTFLKPIAKPGAVYSVSIAPNDITIDESGYTWFEYTITVPNIKKLSADQLNFDAELIVYYDKDTNTALSCSDIVAAGGYAAYEGKDSLSSAMTEDAWTAPITLKLGTLELLTDTVTAAKKASYSNPYTIEASGTISGEFDYAIADPISDIADFATAYALGSIGYKTMGYGKNTANPGKVGWNSDNVILNLYSSSGGGGGYTPPPLLNTEDHFGYIIGYPVDYYTGEKTDDQTKMPVKPQGQITRAEVATIFFRMLTDNARNEYWSQTSSYTDVEADDWFNNAICTLSNAGIISGYPDGSFQPNGKITRAEFATIASRFFDVEASGSDIFPDIDGHWAEQYINEAATAGIINGYEDGTFRPQKLITRAEAVTMVNRTLGRAPDQDHFLPDMLVWPDNMDTSKWYYAQMQEATNSHEYEMKTKSDGTKYEVWTKMLPIRDWQAFEKEWSDSNSSENPGEVV